MVSIDYRNHRLQVILLAAFVVLVAGDYQLLYASKTQSIVRRDSTESFLKLDITDVNTYDNFAVFGYFKITSSATLTTEMAMI